MKPKIYYIKNSNYLDKKTRKVKLIYFKRIKDIYKTYTEVVKNSGLEMFDGIIDEDFLIEKREDYEVVENSYSSENEESSEDIEFEIDASLHKKDNHDDKDNDDKGKGNNGGFSNNSGSYHNSKGSNLNAANDENNQTNKSKRKKKINLKIIKRKVSKILQRLILLE